MSLSRKSKIGLVLLVLGIIVAIFGYRYLYQSHETTSEAPIAYTGDAQSFSELMPTEALAWHGKFIQLSGKVSGSDDKGFTLDGSIYCQWDETQKQQELQLNESITIKARVMGYDDLLEELKLDKTIRIN
ncbi:hypothetical protein [Sediminicola luteus]|uniref:Bacterial OB-fold domain-containing protein n=1 Tax=Sediminicola luteus TaxID=319238 RepID=A0A2A4G9Y3_9FLAO|nr:hypothetical protein [Sediminicola luteus]PCE64796.1 hypothetical protein B7P33_06395 [Sediminicola luteus]